MRPWVRRFVVGDLSARRVFRSLLVIPVMTYAGLTVFSIPFSSDYIFAAPPWRGSDAGLVRLRTADGVSLAARFVEAPGAAFTVVYSHGNADDLSLLDDALEAIRRAGFSVLAYDYRGYGASEGEASESGTYRDVEAAFHYLVSARGIPPERIVSFGHSLGGGPAVHLARDRPVAGLVMESTFVTAFRVMTVYPLLPFDRYRSIRKIDDVKCPVLVIHGTRDDVIPAWHGQALHRAAPEPKRLVLLPGAGHDPVNEGGAAYGEALAAFERELRARLGA